MYVYSKDPLAVNGIPEVVQLKVLGVVTVKLLPDATEGALKELVFVEPILVPVAELKYNSVKLTLVAPFGKPPTEKDTFKPLLLHTAALTANGLNPLLLAVTLALGLKIPIEYRITATMTMIKIAQP